MTLMQMVLCWFVFEVIETRMDSFYLKGRLRDTRNGRSVGWRYLDEYRLVDGGES